MKKLLSILGAIGLTTISTTSLISCQKPNNNENGGGNKLEPKPEKPQEPPIGSNWKLLDKNTIINKIDNKYYFTIWKEYPIKKWKLKMIPLVNEIGIDLINEWIKTQPVYRWDGSNEPKEPTINEETGKITDWKE